ncbi:hypothetical protein C8J57DRAFT_1210484 [Mycena rebaudengoi]|nr:hypothetical protein C8J57DRAFT_1210484 [Mycena rebaudengoi]
MATEVICRRLVNPFIGTSVRTIDTHTMIPVFGKTTLRLQLVQPRSSPLFNAVHANPASIDELLIPHLLDTTLPSAMGCIISNLVTQRITPPLYWGGDPQISRNDYINCVIEATLLSTSAPGPTRNGENEDTVAAAASCLPTELQLQIYADYQLYQQQRRRFWEHALEPIFIKALMSGRDPAPGSRLAAGILVLTCWASMRAAKPTIKGHGTKFRWMSGEFESEAWDMENLEAALQNTEKLPRDNWDVKAMGQFTKVPEYVPLECIKILDVAREHAANGVRDQTSAEVFKFAMALRGLEDVEEATQASAEEGEQSDYMGEAFRDWEKSWDGNWAEQLEVAEQLESNSE